MPAKKAKGIVAEGLRVVGAVVCVGVATKALVPIAMAKFGVVVSGVGTLHAPGGVAATLQMVSHALLQTKVVLGGFAAGATRSYLSSST